MKVKELIELLEGFPEGCEITVYDERDGSEHPIDREFVAHHWFADTVSININVWEVE
jgi:hypothetical protein